MCADPVRKVIAVLLTNRVWPDDNNASKTKIHTVRQGFSTAVQKVVDSMNEVLS